MISILNEKVSTTNGAQVILSSKEFAGQYFPSCRVDPRNDNLLTPMETPEPANISKRLEKWMHMSRHLNDVEPDVSSCRLVSAVVDQCYPQEICSIDSRATDTQAAIWADSKLKQVRVS